MYGLFVEQQWISLMERELKDRCRVNEKKKAQFLKEGGGKYQPRE